MKYIGIILLIIISLSTLGQNNDELLLSKNKVKEVKKVQKIHAFELEAKLCEIESKMLNEDGQIVYSKMDLNCIGWTSKEERFLTYKKGKVLTSKIKRDGEDFEISTFRYGKGKEPVEIRTFFYQTNDSMLVSNKYFRKKGKIDSTYITTVLQDGSIYKTKSIARYNGDNKLVQLYSVNESGEATEMLSNEIDENGVLKSVAFTTYGERESFTQTFFEYNRDGAIDNTINTVNQRQEYFYLDNGLIKNVLSYNPKGELEIEYIFEYSYYE